MEGYRAAYVIMRQNLAEWRRNDRVLVVLGLAFLLLYIYMGGLPVYALEHGQKNSPFILALAFVGGENANGSLKVLLLFGVVVLFCNAPFLDEQKLFLILRSRRKGWWTGEILYIIIGTAVYMSYLFLILCGIVLPCAGMQVGWGDSIMTAMAGSYEAYSTMFSGIRMPVDLLLRASPESSALYVFLVGWMVMCILGLLIYCVNLYTGKAWTGVALAAFVVVLDPVLLYTQNTYNTYRLLLSPASWISMENLKQYSGHGYLTVPYVAAAGIGTILVLVHLIHMKSRRMDILFREEM